jgi:4-hydroxy-tetrahydrodipicolinate reductase
MTQTPAIGVVGCQGRMGRLLEDELQAGTWPACYAGGLVRDRNHASAPLTRPTALPSTESPAITDKAEILIPSCAALIDFSAPDTVLSLAPIAARHHVPYIVGTTGLAQHHEDALRAASAIIPVLYATNMGMGINLLSLLVEQAAARLNAGWDIEILETHHRAKVDAPSGTALSLGQAAAKGRGITLDHHADWARHGKTGARTDGHIGFAVRRGGDVVGEHCISFYGAGERIELSHSATDRRIFARGAIRAALWTIGREQGFYSMRDVLGG